MLEARGPQLRPLIEAAAIPHWFDRHILSALLPEQTISHDAFAALTALPMVEPFQGKGWNVHESTRLELRRWLAVEHPGRLRQLSTYAAAYFQEQADDEAEAIYHRVLASPDSAAKLVDDTFSRFNFECRHAEAHRLDLGLSEFMGFPGAPVLPYIERRYCRQFGELASIRAHGFNAPVLQFAPKLF